MSVVPLHPCADLPGALRAMADDLEAGVYGDTDQATIVFPGASEVFHLGTPANDPDAGASAIFNMTCGITKLTMAVCTGERHG